MKKILIMTLFILIIPFIMVILYDVDEKKEVELKYIYNTFIRVKRNATGVIEFIPFEEYIVGVLAGEMPIYFEKEALKAQAVASRSYALKRMEYNLENDYDVVDTVMNQVYLDNEYLKNVWGENYISNINKLREVVNETYGEYLEYDGKVIDAMFFSTSNGYTEDSAAVFNVDLPYLQSVKSSWDEDTSSAFKSKKIIDANIFYESLGLSYSSDLSINIISRSSTNRIKEICINGMVFSGRDLYNKLGLKSTDFSLEQKDNKIIINTIGYGHGVGMSQYGALGMAKEGYSYVDILSYYYVGTNIKKMEK